MTQEVQIGPLIQLKQFERDVQRTHVFPALMRKKSTVQSVTCGTRDASSTRITSAVLNVRKNARVRSFKLTKRYDLLSQNCNLGDKMCK